MRTAAWIVGGLGLWVGCGGGQEPVVRTGNAGPAVASTTGGEAGQPHADGIVATFGAGGPAAATSEPATGGPAQPPEPLADPMVAVAGPADPAPAPASEAPAAPTASPAPAAPSTTMEVVRRRPALRLGHYSSEDGRMGFVLDQSGATPLLQFDGRSAVVRLAYRSSGGNDVYLSPEDGSGDFSLQPTQWGGGYQYVGPGYYPFGVPVYRDADADPIASR